MDAITTNQPPALPREPFLAATARVNEWRGRCLDGFTRAEETITETLVTLSEIKGRGSKVKLPHLLGQRFDALVAAIEPGAPFAAESRVAAPVLERWRDHAELRNTLCHGTCKITLDAQAKWTAVFRTVSLNSNKVVRGTLAITEREAERLCEGIVQVGRDLSSQLGQLRADLKRSDP